MINKLLNKAEQYRDKREFKQAVEYYKRYMEEVERYPTDTIYVSYANCLSRLKKINESKQILEEGNQIHPNSVIILKELYNIYYSSHKRDKALLIARSLVNVEANNSENYFLLGKACASLGKAEEARTSYMNGLKYKHNMEEATLIKTVEEGLVKEDSEITSEFIFIAGTSNYGAFIHYHNGKKYFTKISQIRRRTKREELFYKELCKDYPFLANYVPNYINSKIIDDILYLTIEMIEGIPIKHANLEEVLSVSQNISSIPYKEITQKYNNPKYPYTLTTPNRLIEYFTQIHKKKYNEKLFSSLFKLFKQKEYPSSVFKIVKEMETLILDNKLYNFINPEEHYSLVHGDFNRRNSLFIEENQLIKVFDWEFFKIGPHFIDIARYLSVNLVSHTDVKKIYLDNKKLGGNLTIIEKIFFLYILILLYIITLREGRVEEEMERCILPAFQTLNLLVNEFKS